MSVHAALSIEIAIAIPLASSQVNAVIGTGKPDQSNQITRLLVEAGCPQMTKKVFIALLLPNVFERPNERTAGVPIMIR